MFERTDVRARQISNRTNVGQDKRQSGTTLGHIYVGQYKRRTRAIKRQTGYLHIMFYYFSNVCSVNATIEIVPIHV